MDSHTNNVCCICGNLVALYTKTKCKLDTPWGSFMLHYHKACETPETKTLVTKKVKEIALANKP